MKPKRVFMEGVRGTKIKHTPLWIVEDWVPWKYYVNKVLDKWMHYLSKIPGARFLVDEIWERRYYPLFVPIETRFVEVPWIYVSQRWNWAKDDNSIRKDQES